MPVPSRTAISALPPRHYQHAINMAKWFPEVLQILGDPCLDEQGSLRHRIMDHPQGKLIEIAVPRRISPALENHDRISQLAEDFESLARRVAAHHTAERLGALADDFEALARRAADQPPRRASRAMQPLSPTSSPHTEALRQMSAVPCSSTLQASVSKPSMVEEDMTAAAAVAVSSGTQSPGRKTLRSARGGQVRQGDAEVTRVHVGIGRSHGRKPSPITIPKEPLVSVSEEATPSKLVRAVSSDAVCSLPSGARTADSTTTSDSPVKRKVASHLCRRHTVPDMPASSGGLRDMLPADIIRERIDRKLAMLFSKDKKPGLTTAATIS